MRAGFPVQLNDSRREVANNFVQQIGGTAPDSLRQLAQASEVVITMLPTSAIVAQVLGGGDDNVFAGIAAGQRGDRDELRHPLDHPGTGARKSPPSAAT